MGKAKLSKGEWAEIKEMVESGGSIPQIAREWDLEPNAIHQRAHREKWKTPKKVVREMLRMESDKIIAALSSEKACQIVKGQAEVSLTEAAQRLGKIRDEMPVEIAENLTVRIRHALTTLPAITNWKEFSTAVNILAEMIGMKKQSVPVVNVGMDWGKSRRPVVILEAEEA